LIVGLVVLLTILFLDSIFYYLPKVVLASLIIVAAIGLQSPFALHPTQPFTSPSRSGLVEYEDLFFLWKIRDLGAIALLLSTFLVTGMDDHEPMY
jgi:hypothetical protein